MKRPVTIAAAFVCMAALSASTFARLLSTTSGPDITTGLAAYWALNEASGNAVDSSGNSRTMTQNGTIGAGSGGTASSRGTFSSANYFSRTDTTLAQLNSADYTITGWFYLSSASGTQIIIDNWWSSSQSWVIYYSAGAGSSDVGFSIADGGGTGYPVLGSGAAVGAGVWHFYAATFNSSTKAMTMTVDNGTPGTYTFPAVPSTTSMYDTTIGRLGDPGTALPFGGYLGKTRIYAGRILDSSVLSYLYNGGTFSTAP